MRLLDPQTLNPPNPQTPDQVIDALARQVVARRLETPAVLFLETHRPLAFLASQAILFSAPVLGAFFDPHQMNQLAEIVDSPGGVDRLLDRIEELARERDAQEREGRGER